MSESLSPIRQQILDFIISCQRERQIPPSIREIGAHVGLSSPATVKRHIDILREDGFITSNPQQPRTITLKREIEAPSQFANRSIPFVGDVAAGTGVLANETQMELMNLPEEFTGRGESYVLQVRGDSMINAGILPGDYVVVARQETAQQGEIVVAGIPGEEATVKRFFPQGTRVILQPENDTMEPMDFDANEIVIYGRVLSVLRRY